MDSIRFSQSFGQRSVFCAVWGAFRCAWVLVIAAYGGNILAPVLTLISLRTLKKALISLRFQQTPPPPRGGPLLKHPTFARASLGNEALCSGIPFE